MVHVVYEQDESGLWRFIIYKNEKVQAITDFEYASRAMMKRTVGEICEKIITEGKYKEKIKKTIIRRGQ